jgi:endonuclease YncB( thermonuclease family)
MHLGVARAEPTAILIDTGRAIDSDGIVIGHVEVRLQGIAAPEWSDRAGHDPGGRAALKGLASMVDGREVRCELDGTTASSGRPVGVCFVGGHDVGRRMVEMGLARDCPRFSGGRYKEAEAQARVRGADLSRIYHLPGYCTPR